MGSQKYATLGCWRRVLHSRGTADIAHTIRTPLHEVAGPNKSDERLFRQLLVCYADDLQLRVGGQCDKQRIAK